MSDPIVVAFPDMQETSKRALHELISPFFNGQQHTVGGVEIQFPVANVNFDRQGNNPAALLISFVYLSSSVTEYKVSLDVGEGQKRAGKEVRSKVDILVVLRIQKDASDPAKSLLALDKAWAALYAVFACKVADFAARGIHYCHLNPNPYQIDNLPMQVVIGESLSLELRAQYICDDKAS